MKELTTEIVIMDGINTLLLIVGIIILLIVGGISTFLYIKNKNRIRIWNEQIDINKNMLKNEILDKLEKLEEEFIDTATSYFLRLGLLESELSTEKQKNILSNYPKVISQPKLKWSDFTIINKEGILLNELIEEKVQDYVEKDSFTVKDSFNYFLLEKAEKQAQQIINEKEKNV